MGELTEVLAEALHDAGQHDWHILGGYGGEQFCTLEARTIASLEAKGWHLAEAEASAPERPEPPDEPSFDSPEVLALADAIEDATGETDPTPWDVLMSLRRSGWLLLRAEAGSAPERPEPLASKLTAVIEDAESQHPGGWGPDVTTLGIIREVRDALLAVPLARLDTALLARAIDEAGTFRQDEQDWSKTRPKRPTEIAQDAAPIYARLASLSPATPSLRAALIEAIGVSADIGETDEALADRILDTIHEPAVLATPSLDADLLAHALVASGLIGRLADYAMQAHPDTMAREPMADIARSWARDVVAEYARLHPSATRREADRE